MEHIYHGCPICHKDVKGSEEHKYYCRHCRVLFNKKDLKISKKQVKLIVKKHIIKRFDRNLIKKVYMNDG